MSTYISATLRRQVIERADNRCEYCLLHQAGQEATFHVDHVTPLKSGGETTLDNLALACVSCSLHKSAKEFVLDEEIGELVPVFNPRKQAWHEHFRWKGYEMEGLTASGRATIIALRQNRSIILMIRGEEKILGRHP